MIQSRNVLVRANDEFEASEGTGAKIGDGLVLTDLHVVVDRIMNTVMTRITVDGVPAKVLKFDAPNDLAVLEMSGHDSTPRLELRYNSSLVLLNQPVITVGNPLNNTGIFQTGIIARETFPRHRDMFQILVIEASHGASGSLIYTPDGVCVGILQQFGENPSPAEDKMHRLFGIRNLRPVEQLLRNLRSSNALHHSPEILASGAFFRTFALKIRAVGQSPTLRIFSPKGFAQLLRYFFPVLLDVR